MKYFFFSISVFLFQNIFSQQYNFKQYSVGDGLAQSQVYALLEDHDGYIWMGTQGGGISKFDGQDFINYSTKDGISNNYIHSLAQDDSGIIYIGSQDGLTIFNGTFFAKIKSQKQLKIESIKIDPDEKVWLGTNQGLFFYENDTLTRYSSKNRWVNENIHDIHIDPNGTMWLATDYGVVKIDSEKEYLFSQKEGLRSRLINAIHRDTDDVLWVSTYGEGIYRMKNNKFEAVKEFKNKIVFDFLSVNKTLWLGTLQNGISVYHTLSENYSHFDVASGLPANKIHSLLKDSWGNIWVGTSGSGVACYSGQQFEYYNRDTGLPGRQIYSLEKDNKNNLYLGISDQGLYKYSLDSLIKLKHIDGIDNVKVKALYNDRLNRLWIGTDNKGCYLYENDSLTQVTGLSSDWIKAFAEDKNNNIYVATAGGGINIIHFTDSSNYQVDILTKHNGLNENRITDLIVDSRNRVWFSTVSHGIGVILPDRTIIMFTENDGLISNEVRSLAIDGNQRLWIASPTSGITTMDLLASQLSFSTFPYPNENVIYLLQFDKKGNLWIGTESGLDKLLLNEKVDILEKFHFGKSDGFLGVETCTNSSIMDNEGQLWFGTIDGFCKTKPEDNVINLYPPKLKVNHVNLFYKPLQETKLKHFLSPDGSIQDTLILTYSQNHLTFNFKGIDLVNPENVTYQWKLLGLEDSWAPFSKNSQVSYSNLKPGEYSFQVKSCNKDGACNIIPEIVNFTILAPFWQKLWFKFVFICGVLLLILITSGSIIKNIRKKSREKNQRLQLEKNVLELEQKALRLQMNPHFIFNSLNSIQGLIASNNNKDARLSLSRFSKLMRQTLENSRESFITVEDEISMLKNYLDLEKHTHNNKFDYQIAVSDDAIEELIPPLLIQPFVENAIIHGVVPKEKGGIIKINFSVVKNQILIQVEDNGIGREKSAKKNASLSTYHKSTGLRVTQERINNLGGTDEIQFVDLKDNEGVSLGTLVKIRLPLQD